MKSKPYKEISLRPYSGHMFYAKTRKGYEQAHKELFQQPDVLNCSQGGRFSGGCGKDGIWTYLLWADTQPYLAHEIAHVVLHTFERCGIDPREANGEPFCYMLSQILMDIKS